MPVRIRVAHLALVVEPIRPEVAAPAADGRRGPVKGAHQRQGGGPGLGGAVAVERVRLADAQRVRDLVERHPLRHVAAVLAEAYVAVDVAVGRRHGRVVLDRQGLGRLGRQGRVPRDGRVHGRGDLGVGVCLVRRGARGLPDGVRELCRREEAEGGAEEDVEQLHFRNGPFMLTRWALLWLVSSVALWRDVGTSGSSGVCIWSGIMLSKCMCQV